MIEQYHTTDELKVIAKQIDKTATSVKGIERRYRQYYISYFDGDTAVLYLWFNKDRLFIYFKDKEGCFDGLDSNIPHGITEGFNKRIKVVDDKTKEKAQKIILQYLKNQSQ